MKDPDPRFLVFVLFLTTDNCTKKTTAIFLGYTQVYVYYVKVNMQIASVCMLKGASAQKHSLLSTSFRLDASV